MTSNKDSIDSARRCYRKAAIIALPAVVLLAIGIWKAVRHGPQEFAGQSDSSVLSDPLPTGGLEAAVRASAGLAPSETGISENKSPSKTVADPPSITPQQQEAAFRQLRQALGREARREGGRSEKLADVAGTCPQWVEEDFVVRTDDYGNVIARNPAQGFEADFTDLGEKGLRVRHPHADAALTVRLSAIGSRRDAMHAVDTTAGAPETDGSRVEFARGDGVTEWYVNGEDGLEQGWTIEGPLPGADRPGELRLGLELAAGDMEAMFEPGHRRKDGNEAIVFRDRKGREVWRYDKLRVFDAEGHDVPARMEWDGPGEDGPARVDLVVAAAGAAFPLTVDPLVSSILGNLHGSSPDSSPSDLIAMGDTLFFSANDGSNGNELWKSDGTIEGTALVRDILSGDTGSNPSKLVAIGGTLFFTARYVPNYSGLWKSDGTAAGTVFVKEGPIYDLTAAGDTLFLTRYDNTHGVELWKSDGTTAGTVLVKDINPGSDGSYFEEFAAVGNTLFAVADDGTHGRELWKSDGTATGTVLVKDINPENVSSLDDLTTVGDTLFFKAWDSVHGSELWKSDGTAPGTVMVKDINPGSDHSFADFLTAVGSTLYFTARDFTHGKELWKSNGTAAGTVLVKDIRPGYHDSNPFELTVIGSTVYFRASDGIHGLELWKTNGTAAGTVLVKDVFPGGIHTDSWPRYLTAVGNTLFFTAWDGVTGRELWKSNGTTGGTVLVKDIDPVFSDEEPERLTAVGNTLFFVADDRINGEELWKSNGTTGGTTLVRDINPVTDPVTSSLISAGGILYFSGIDGTRGAELWRSNGTAAGTFLIKDINPGMNSSSPGSFVAVGNTIFFTADNGSSGVELWKSNGTGGGTVLVKDIWTGGGSSSPTALTESGGTLFFQASDGTGGAELWRSNGTFANTFLVKDINPGAGDSFPDGLATMGGMLYFRADDGVNGSELWTSDGTAGGTTLVKNIHPDGDSSSPAELTPMGGTLFFRTEGNQLWKSDGTEGGTLLVRDFPPSSVVLTPGRLTVVGSTLFFNARDSAAGTGLWKSDGTPAGTTLVREYHGNYGVIYSPTRVGDTLFFRADGGNSTGDELWKSDGTTGGTTLVKDISPGSSYPSVDFLTVVGGRLFFRADDGLHGTELWKSDGTGEGTVLAEDLYPGPESSWPANLFALDDETLIFEASGATGGRDLRVLSLVASLHINEVQADSLSSNTLDFIELFDCGVGSTPLDDVVVILFDGATDTSYRTIDLSGESTDPHGYFVIGNANVANVDLVLPDDFIQGGADAVALFEAAASSFPDGTPVTTTSLVDAVVHDTGDPDDAGLLALLNPGQPQLDENQFGPGHSLQRLPNGDGGTRNTSGFSALSPTPGEANSLPPAPAGIVYSGGIPPTLSGTARAGSVVVVSSDIDGVMGTAQTDAAGNWTLSLAGAVSDARHEISAAADGGPVSPPFSAVVDVHDDGGGSPTAVSLTNDNGTANGWMEDGDADVFTFTVVEARHVLAQTVGGVDTLGRLRNEAGDLVNDPVADDDFGPGENFRIWRPLPAGTFTIEVTSKGAATSGAYQLEITLGAFARFQPDNRVGSAAKGNNLYGGVGAQTLKLISRKARTVREITSIQNDGEVPDDFTLSGTRGNGLFQVNFMSPNGNVTAAVVSGSYQTGTLAPDGSLHKVTAVVKPNRKKILKKIRRGGRWKLKVKKKKLTLTLRSVSGGDSAASDTTAISVQTK